MSAICGIYSLYGNRISFEDCNKIMDAMDKYPSDCSDTWYDNRIFLGYSSKYITPESKSEKLPYYSEFAGLAITSDAIIDNRNDLIQQLNLDRVKHPVITDSELILAAYQKWGEHCPNHLIGDYSFVIWDSHKNELFCARDHVGKRTLYYYHQNDIFAFSTAMNPLREIKDEKNEFNELWITNFLSMPGVAHDFDCDQTVYKNIYQLLSAHSMKVSVRGIELKKYWFPLEGKKIRFKSDQEYDEAFLDVFGEAVNCRLRSIGSVGVMMSGGLDSGSVACLAAKQLKARGESLKAFSSIPYSDYQDWCSKSAIANELPYIEAIKNYAGNIDLTYCECKNKNSLSEIERLIEILEQPYKIIENSFWYDEIARLSAENGCSVLLDGQFGNLSISFGDFFVHALSLFKSAKFVSLLKEIRGYSQLYQLGKADVGADVLKSFSPYWFKRMFYHFKQRTYDNKTYLPTNPDLYTKWNVNERFQKEGWGLYPYPDYDLHQMRKRILRPQSYTHLGALETMVSLNYGIAKRDPTRDKRVIEFCLNIPGDQLVRDGQERYLIRKSMKGILPESVRLNYMVRGQQSADWIQRIAPEWGSFTHKLNTMLEYEELQSYLNINKLKDTIENIQGDLREDQWGEIRMLIISYVFSRFILNKSESERK